jgi:prepilin-type N-terminal cleavage/methylation domain-containing protein/prepilin-type processing-associated H-X9-DG protein
MRCAIGHGCRRCSPAFSLIELLVVLAIISILIAIYMPAVQSAREATRRISCANNLKQIGIALQNYHDSAGALPPGWVAAANSTGENAGPGWGWNVRILPLMEQQALYQSLNLYLPIEAVDNFTSVTRRIKSLACPSDGLFEGDFAVVGLATPGDRPGEAICRVGSSSYPGCFGTGDPSAIPGRDLGDGIFMRNQAVRLAQITDGTSETILVGERSQDVSQATWTGAITGAVVPLRSVRGERGLDPVGGDALVVSQTGVTDGPNASPARADLFSSKHPGGCQFLWCDGSVRFLKERRSLASYQAMATRAGGEVLTDDDF